MSDVSHPTPVSGTPVSVASPVSPDAPTSNRSQVGKLAVLMITAFIDMLGMWMILPLLPFYATTLGADGLLVGMLVSSFSVAQLLSAPYWGRFSDRYGRRPALMVGLASSAIAYVVFAYADSLWLMFLSRIIQGAGGGTVSVIQAYVADATKPEDRAKSLGWLSAATNAGVAIGPVIGSWVQHLGLHTPGLIAAALCVVNMGFAYRYLTEARKSTAAERKAAPPRSSREAVWRVVSHPDEPASRLIMIYAIAIGAFQGTYAVLALFLAYRFGLVLLGEHLPSAQFLAIALQLLSGWEQLDQMIPVRGHAAGLAYQRTSGEQTRWPSGRPLRQRPNWRLPQRHQRRLQPGHQPDQRSHRRRSSLPAPLGGPPWRPLLANARSAAARLRSPLALRQPATSKESPHVRPPE